MTRTILAPDQVAALRADIEAGLPYADIADKYGVGMSTVWYQARKIGHTRYAERSGRATTAAESAAKKREAKAAGVSVGLFVDQPWAKDARCAQIGGDLWFPETGNADSGLQQSFVREAKAICNGTETDGRPERPPCPVREQCLAWALANDEAHGVWGGTTPLERRRMRRDGTAAEIVAKVAAGQVVAPAPAVTTQQRGMSYVGGANGGSHYPLPTAPQHIEGRGNAKPSIDWGTPTTPAATTSALRCRWCRNVADPADLVDDLCTACHIDAELKFTGPVAVPDLDHDDTPEESPDTHPEHEHEEHDPMTTYPDYVRQMADVMARSEGHADPGMKAARKVVANAFVALNKTLGGSTVTPAKPTTGRGGARPRTDKVRRHAGDGVKATAARLVTLGVTAKDVRTWAVGQGLDVPSRGAVPGRLIDAWEQAHRQDGAA